MLVTCFRCAHILSFIIEKFDLTYKQGMAHHPVLTHYHSVSFPPIPSRTNFETSHMYGANSSIHILIDFYRKQFFLKKSHILKKCYFSVMPVTLVPVHISPVYLLGTMRTCRDICISEYIYIYIYIICVNIYTYICSWTKLYLQTSCRESIFAYG